MKIPKKKLIIVLCVLILIIGFMLFIGFFVVPITIDYFAHSSQNVPLYEKKSTFALEFPEVEHEKNIPHIIYRTQKHRGMIKVFEKCLDQTKIFAPDFKEIFFDDEDVYNFIKDNYSERILNAFNLIRNDFGAAKADLFRYLLIYLKGGVYMDIKSSICSYDFTNIIDSSNGDILLSNNKVLPFYSYYSYLFGPKGEYNQWYIAAPKGHPVLKILIENIVYNIERDHESEKQIFYGGPGVCNLTGPIMFTKIFKIHAEYQKFLGCNLNNSLIRIYEVYSNYKILYKENGAKDYWEVLKPVVIHQSEL